jgi:hypothetical protein
MIGMVHKNPGEMPTLVNRMPVVPGLPQMAGGMAGATLQGPGGSPIGLPGYEVNTTPSLYSQVAQGAADQGLGAMVHGQGLGAPLVHGMGLGDFGVSDADLDKMAVALHAKGGNLTAMDIRDAMKGLTKEERNTLGAKLIALGVPAGKVSTGKTLGAIGTPEFKKRAAIWGVLGTISMAASTYHGYKRNDSIGWALWWGLMGALFPIVTPVIGVAQGFAKPKGS